MLKNNIEIDVKVKCDYSVRFVPRIVPVIRCSVPPVRWQSHNSIFMVYFLLFAYLILQHRYGQNYLQYGQ